MAATQGANEAQLRRLLEGVSQHERFELELEFVQCLANPEYLNWLAQTRHFEDAAFVKFLAYLQYWHRPEYSHFITFPHCLYMLRQVQKPEFRKALKRRDIQIAIAWQQDYFFRHFRTNRLRDQGAEARAAAAGAGAGSVAGGAAAMDES